MNLNTVTDVKQPLSVEEIEEWRDGYAWLAGGTWLFSTPQVGTHTLIDLQSLRWPALQVSADGLEIAATCTLAELARIDAPATWKAAPLFKRCCDSLLASFKVWNAATVGGNICMSLPAGSMISLTASLEGTYTLWPRDAAPRKVAAVDFVAGNHANVLQSGELLRSIHLPASALCKRFAFRRASLTHAGRSAIIVIGTQNPGSGDLVLTVTAATAKPFQLRFASVPDGQTLREAIFFSIPEADYFNDVHGSARYKRHLTYYFAEQIRVELLSGAET
jgi:CO/xanthine dehydrogenase FAD-binding subunit